ncbi:hypothetical protein KJ359_009133 [Pestalotiopsis sp. 9143b]|nr:hypothetical protein KJ359_009133 [Pestalotiopsis sp. 9143b]
MRFATSSIIAVLCASTANAQIAGATKLVADVTKLTTDLTAVPPNTGALLGDANTILNDATALLSGAGGLGGIGAGTTPAVANAFLTQIVNTVCPALVAAEASVPKLPLGLAPIALGGAIGLAVGALQTAIGRLPTGAAGVDTTAALACLNAVTTNVKRDVVESVPVEFSA